MLKKMSDAFDGMLKMTSEFIDEAASTPAPSRGLRRVLWVVFTTLGALVVLGWIVLLVGE